MPAAFAAAALDTRTQRRWLAALLLTALVLRTWLSVGPELDRTAWKEMDYLMVVRNLLADFDPLHPRVTWPAEGTQVTAMELPLVPVLAAGVASLFGESAVALRMLSTVAWLGAAWLLCRLLTRRLGPLVGLGAAALALVMGTHHEFGRMLLSEPWIVFATLLSLDRFDLWLNDRQPRDAWLSVAGLSLAVALKPTALHALVPLAWLWLRPGVPSRMLTPRVLGLLGAALLLPVAWYAWANHFELTGMGEFSVFRGHDKFQTAAMLGSSAWWWTVVRHGIVDELLGGWPGLLLVLLGVGVVVWWRRGLVLLAASAGGAAYTLIVAEGHMDAPYRQLELVPALAGLGAVGAVGLGAALSSVVAAGAARGRLRTAVWLGALLVVPAGLDPAAWVRARDRERPAHPDRWAAAETIRTHTPDSARLVVAGEYDVKKGGNDLSPVLFTYAGRPGWSLQPGDLTAARVEALRARGATHLAVLPAWSAHRNVPDALDAADGPAFVAAMRRRWPLLAERPGGALLLFSLEAPLPEQSRRD